MNKEQMLICIKHIREETNINNTFSNAIDTFIADWYVFLKCRTYDLLVDLLDEYSVAYLGWWLYDAPYKIKCDDKPIEIKWEDKTRILVTDEDLVDFILETRPE